MIKFEGLIKMSLKYINGQFFLRLFLRNNLLKFFKLGLVIFCATKCDLNRLTKGFDDCGNVCGKNNKNLGISSCTVKLNRVRTLNSKK